MFVPVPSPAEAAPAAPPVPGRRRPPRLRRAALTPYLYVLPAVLLLVAWTYKPLVETFGLSFYQWNLIPTAAKRPVGLANYQTVLALPELHQALINTVFYIGALAIFSLALPLLIALVARRIEGRARVVYQALIFVPHLVTPVATSAVWRWLLDQNGGAVTTAAARAGIELGNVFRDPALVAWAVVIIAGWSMIGFGVLVISAGLAGINADYAAAAALDGAGPGRILTRITVPLLSPTLTFLAMMTILFAAQSTYPVIDILTQGGPSGASTNIYYLLYQFGFRNFDAGLSAAAGVLFFLGFGIIAAIFVELSERLSFYDN